MKKQMPQPAAPGLPEGILEALAAAVAIVRRDGEGNFVVDRANRRLAVLLRDPLEPGRRLDGLVPPALLTALADVESGRESWAALPGIPIGPLDVPCTVTVALPSGSVGPRRPVVTCLPEASKVEVAGPAAEELRVSLGNTALDLLDMQSELVCQWRPEGTVLYCNEAFAWDCGRSQTKVVGANIFELRPPAEMEQILANVARLTVAEPAASYDHEIEGLGGTTRWQEWIDRALFDAAGRVQAYLSVGRDITARKRAEQALAKSKQRLRLALEAGRLGAWDSDVVRGLIRFDPICLERLGFRAERLERPLAEVVDMIHSADRRRVRRAYERLRSGERETAALQYRVCRADGSYAWIEEHALVAERGRDGEPSHIVGVSADITERKHIELRLAHLASHDSLTGLPNRRALAEALERAVAQAQRAERGVALLVLDLERFKELNDRYGHPVGDRVLDEVAVRLRRAVRRSDLVARLGGDEFAVVAGDLKAPSGIARVARRIRSAVQAPLEAAGHNPTLDVSIGIALYPGDGTTPEELLRSADHALHAAKRAGAGVRFSGEAPALPGEAVSG